MIVISQTIVLLLLAVPVWAALECTDWEGKSISDGSDFNPKKEDPCYTCRCDRGQSTMCRTVSCAAPNCKYWQQIPGKCCQFECLDTGIPDSDMKGRENYTSSPPTGPNSGTVGDATMTDLGLRLAASTVTTFLILALLLFLLHRLRQKRLRMALRRYSRRRQDLDDSDNASYSPDFFGLQSPPPYEDPPPPYSPPKPRHPHGRDQPPPYDAIDDNGNTEICNVDRNGNQTVNRSQNQPGVTGSDGQHRNTGSSQNRQIPVAGAFNYTGAHDLIDPRNLRGRYSERTDRNFCTNMTNVITSDRIQNQPYSSIQPETVQRAEIRNELNQNGQLTHNHSYVSDIGESTSSSEPGDSRNSSPVPTEYENRTLSLAHEGRQPGTNLESGVALSEDAETTVKQFLDKQFGQMAKNRNINFPTSLSQSWSCSEQTSTAPHLGLAGSINRNSGYFQRSPKGISGLVRVNNAEISQNNVPKMGIRCGKCNNIIACKCNKMKTNGLLTRSQSDYTQNATNSAPKETVPVSRNRNVRLLPGSFGARVSYVEPEDTTLELSPKPTSQTCSSQYHSDSETNISYFAPDTERISPNISQCDDLELQTGTQRQKLLRELRLSHLLFSPATNSGCPPSPDSSMHTNRVIGPPKSRNIQSPNSAFTVCSNKGGNTSEKPFSGVISNDAQYPETSFDFVQPAEFPGTSTEQSNIHNNNTSICDAQQKCKLNFSTNTLQSVDRMTVLSEEDNTRQYSRSNFRHMPQENNSKERNSDLIVNSVDRYSNTVPKESHFGVHAKNGFNLNVNTDVSAMKFCNDKDVSRFISSGIPPHLDLVLNKGQVNGIPSVSDRATASQFYNFEHEDKTGKKSKKKLLRKRHSAGSFTDEKDASSRKADRGQKNSQRQKSATLKSKYLRQLDVSDNDQSNSDGAIDNNVVAARQYYPTVDSHKPLPVKTGILPLMSAVTPTKHKSSPKKSLSLVDYSNDSRGVHKGVSRVGSDVGFITFSPVHNSSSSANIGANNFPKSSCHSDSRSQSLHGKKSHKRSKSLGKDEYYVGVHVGNKHGDKYASQKQSSRKKKNRQSFPGTNAFHRELEHVLESQKQAMTCSMAKAGGQQRVGETNLRAVTQV